MKYCPNCKASEIGDHECIDCNGAGEIDYEICHHCDGDGYFSGEMECYNCGEVFDEGDAIFDKGEE